MHATEKILAEHAGLPEVRSCDVITAKVDFAEINDLYPKTIESFYEMGRETSGFPWWSVTEFKSYLRTAKKHRLIWNRGS